MSERLCSLWDGSGTADAVLEVLVLLVVVARVGSGCLVEKQEGHSSKSQRGGRWLRRMECTQECAGGLAESRRRSAVTWVHVLVLVVLLWLRRPNG